MVGVIPTFYGFMIDGVKKGAVLVYTLYLHKKMAHLNTHCTGYWYTKDLSIVFTDTLCFNFTEALPNKNKEKKKMEKFGYITKCQKLLKQLPNVSVIVRITKQH